LTKRRWLLALAPIAGYGGAWIGHFFVEKNRPAHLQVPAMELQGRTSSCGGKMAMGKMDAEVERVLAAEKAAAEKAATSEPRKAEPEARARTCGCLLRNGELIARVSSGKIDRVAGRAGGDGAYTEPERRHVPSVP